MPKKEIDYSNTIIYKIVCRDTAITDCYVGHTTNFTKRKYGHKSNCNNEKVKNYSMNVYQFIRDNGNWDNWDMIEIERYNAIDENDAKKRERFYIEALNAKLNIRIPTRTLKEYYDDNQENILKEKKEYYEENRETLLEKAKKYHEENKIKIKEYRKEYFEKNKEFFSVRQKEYRENNKEKIVDKSKKYYQNNIDKMKEKVICECGCEVCKRHITRHRTSKKHLDLVSLKSIEKCS